MIGVECIPGSLLQCCTWWRHQMETFPASLAFVRGIQRFPSQRPVTRGFDVFFDLRLFKRLSKQSWGWWFETSSSSLWRHCNDIPMNIVLYLTLGKFLMLINYFWIHYNDVTMSVMASHITSLTIVYSTVYLGADQRKHQSYASLTFVRGIHRWPVNSTHKEPVT